MTGLNEAAVLRKIKAPTAAKGTAVGVGERRAAELAREFISILRRRVAAIPREQMPQSVRDHFDSLAVGAVTKRGGGVAVEVNFEDDLRRKSLVIKYGEKKGQRTGPGVNNIVAIFNSGYQAKDMTYGVWEGHGEENIASRQSRAGLHFMQEAVTEFERLYGDKYAVTVELDPVYEFEPNYL